MGPPLIPGLHDDLALLCLLRATRSCHGVMRQVSRGWWRALNAGDFFERRRDLNLAEEWLYVRTRDSCFHNVWRAFDPSSRKWHRIPPVPHDGEGNVQIRGLGCVAANGKLYVFGGWREGGPALRDVYSYDPRFHRWSRVADMAGPRCYMACGAIDKCIYVAGGMSRPRLHSDELLITAEKYDTEKDRWEPIANMVSPVLFSCGTAYGGNFYVSGNFIIESQGGQVYSPQSDRWSPIPSRTLASALMAPCATSADRLVCLKDSLQIWDSARGEWESLGANWAPSGSTSSLGYVALIFLKDRLVLVRRNAGLVALDFDTSLEDYMSKTKEGRGGILVKRIEYLTQGVVGPDEQTIDCQVLKV